MREKNNTKQYAEGTLLCAFFKIHSEVTKPDFKFNEDFFKEQADLIDFVCEKLSISPIQAVFLSFLICSETGQVQTASTMGVLQLTFISDLCFKYLDGEEDLRIRKFIRTHRKDGWHMAFINSQAQKAIANSEAFFATDYANSSPSDFFELLKTIFTESYTFDEANEEMKLFIENNPQLSLVQFLKNQCFSEMEQMLFVYFVYAYSSENQAVFVLSEVKNHEVFNSSIDTALLLSNLEASKLVKNELVERIVEKQIYKIKKSVIKQFLT